ncbi:MAG TPA: ABC transporter permease [Thermoanaerobaculia bacterium]|nr:ABC transporter permease [Thermoanaerobaculia bacterium]
MTVFILRRMIESVFVIFAITLIVYFGVHLIGNPIDVLVGPDCAQACRAEAAARLGLDRPLWEQYLTFLSNLLRGDLGRSYAFGLPALGIVLERLPATLELAAVAMLMAVVIGFPLGVWAGLRRESAAGRLIMAISVLGFSIPTFWIGILLIIVFAVELGLLPVTGRGQTATLLGASFSFLTIDGLKHLLLPAATLALYKISLIIRLTRNGATEVLLTDYIRFARAKGLRPARVVGLHAMKNIMIPIVTVLGIEFGTLIAFAVVTETIFSWPGVGKLIIDSIKTLDRPVIIAYMLVTAILFVTINLVVDILYSLLDPRVRLESA